MAVVLVAVALLVADRELTWTYGECVIQRPEGSSSYVTNPPRFYPDCPAHLRQEILKAWEERRRRSLNFWLDYAELEPDAPPEVDIEIGAEELLAAFIADKDAALAEYAGQYARIHGVIRESYSGGSIMVAGGDYANGVICNLDAGDYESQKDRQPGEPITITGTIIDYRVGAEDGVFTAVVTRECRVAKQTEFGADELLAAFIADRDAALAEYSGRSVRINGMIGKNRPSTSDDSFGNIGVAGGDDRRTIDCKLGAGDYESQKDRQPGEPITITVTIIDYREGGLPGEEGAVFTGVVTRDCQVEIDEHSDSTDAPPEFDIEIGADELFAAFTVAEISVQYAGQYARINGMIREKHFSPYGRYIMVTGGDYGNGVSCYLDAEDYEAQKDLQPGEPITITGTISDYWVEGVSQDYYAVAIEDCQVEIDEHSDSTDAPPEFDIEVGADELFGAAPRWRGGPTDQGKP